MILTDKGEYISVGQEVECLGDGFDSDNPKVESAFDQGILAGKSAYDRHCPVLEIGQAGDPEDIFPDENPD